LKAQAKPQLPRTWIWYPPRSSLSKRRGSPDREKANLALHSFSMVSWMMLMIGFAAVREAGLGTNP
jgi:hypothetical protein